LGLPSGRNGIGDKERGEMKPGSLGLPDLAIPSVFLSLSPRDSVVLEATRSELLNRW